jgi:hypothetical protein
MGASAALVHNRHNKSRCLDREHSISQTTTMTCMPVSVQSTPLNFDMHKPLHVRKGYAETAGLKGIAHSIIIY